MFGNTIGSLNVWVKPQTGNATKVWELKGQQGVQWLQGQVAVSSAQSYQVKFHEHYFDSCNWISSFKEKYFKLELNL